MPRLFLHDSREAMQDSGSLCAACRCLRHEILSVALDEPGLHGPAHGLAGIIADAGSIAEGIERSGLGLHAAELGIAEEDRDHLLARDGGIRIKRPVAHAEHDAVLVGPGNCFGIVAVSRDIAEVRLCLRLR